MWSGGFDSNGAQFRGFRYPISVAIGYGIELTSYALFLPLAVDVPHVLIALKLAWVAWFCALAVAGLRSRGTCRLVDWLPYRSASLPGAAS